MNFVPKGSLMVIIIYDFSFKVQIDSLESSRCSSGDVPGR